MSKCSTLQADFPIAGQPSSTWASRTHCGSTRGIVHNALRLRSTVRWYRRLGARVAVGLTLLIGLSLGSVLVATTRGVRSRVLSCASVALESARPAYLRPAESLRDAATVTPLLQH